MDVNGDDNKLTGVAMHTQKNLKLLRELVVAIYQKL
jgi:hypothetical protein